jgi:hypothetical protein
MLRSRFMPSPQAVELYDLMLDYMERNGYIGYEQTIKLSLEIGERFGFKNMRDIRGLAEELERASLVMKANHDTGWIIRLPVITEAQRRAIV